LRRKIFPVPVTLNLLATAFRVFAVPFDLAMGRGTYREPTGLQAVFFKV
jgi:hypothetical protein